MYNAAKYAYEGPVTSFGKCIANNWRGETVAPSKERAKSNLIFQFKKHANLLPGASVELPGTITEVSPW